MTKNYIKIFENENQIEECMKINIMVTQKWEKLQKKIFIYFFPFYLYIFVITIFFPGLLKKKNLT